MKIFFIYCSLLLFLSACANCKQMHSLQIGMSEQEVVKIMDRSPSKVSASSNSKIIYYSCRGSMPDSGMKFIDNKLVAYGPESQVNADASTSLVALTQNSWSKEGSTDANQFNKDKYDCAKQAERSYATGGSGLVGMMKASQFEEKQDKKEYDFFVMCMESKGYKKK